MTKFTVMFWGVELVEPLLEMHEVLSQENVSAGLKPAVNSGFNC